MSLDLFAGVPVSDHATAVEWYQRLLGSPPAFSPHATESVWELAEHRYVYVVEQPERAGCGLVTLFVDDLDVRVAAIAVRGLEPLRREAFPEGVQKISYHDPDGNEIAFGGRVS